MAIDSTAYVKTVLTPFTKSRRNELLRALNQLKSDPRLPTPEDFDLPGFYLVTHDLRSDADVAAHLDAAAAAMKSPRLAILDGGAGARTIQEFHKLVSSPGRNSTFRSTAFWNGLLSEQTNRAKKAQDEFVQVAAENYKALGVATATELRDIATRMGMSNLSEAELAQLFRDSGIVVAQEFTRPAVNPQVLKNLSDWLDGTSHQGLVSVIYFRRGSEARVAPDSFTILDRFSRTPPGPDLSLAVLREAVERAAPLPQDQDENKNIQNILNNLAKEARSDDALLEIVKAWHIDRGKRVLAQLPLARAALNEFVRRTGLDRTDAGRILHAANPSSGSQTRGFSDVQALVSAGTLKEARRLYEALVAELGGSTSSEQEKALQTLRGTEAKVEELRRKAQAAQNQGDLETAAKALNKALTICSDDETLVAAARSIPPAAPIRFVAAVSEDARVAKLSWEPGFGSTDDVLYQLIRKVGTAPLNNADGTVVGNGIPATSFEEARPPVAVKVYYGVSASRGGGGSPVAIAEAMALPPVTDVVVTSDQSSVTLRWTTPPEASTVEVVQTAPDGSSSQLKPGYQSGTTSGALRMGATYTYLLTAVYVGTSGERLKSATVRATGIPRGTPRPVDGITISAEPAAGTRPQVRVEWQRVEGYAVEVWHYAQKPTWPSGTRLPMSEIRSQGSQLAGRSITTPRREGVQGATDQGLRYYVSVTRDGELGLVGAVQAYGSAPPVQNLRAERFGDEAVLSWDWPGPEYEVQVRWNGVSSGERIIAMSEYRREGGCRVPLGSGGGTLEVATVAGEGDARWLSSATSLTVEGTVAAVEYDIEFQRKLFGPPGRATLKFSMPASATPIDVVVVAHFDKWMPSDSSQGSVLKRMTVSASSTPVEVLLPRGRKGPVWVRVFATTPGARLIDPSPTRMKIE